MRLSADGPRSQEAAATKAPTPLPTPSGPRAPAPKMTPHQQKKQQQHKSELEALRSSRACARSMSAVLSERSFRAASPGSEVIGAGTTTTGGAFFPLEGTA